MACKLTLKTENIPFFDCPQSSCLTRYQKIILGGSLGCTELLKFICQTMKFHNCHHANVNADKICHQLPLPIFKSVFNALLLESFLMNQRIKIVRQHVLVLLQSSYQLQHMHILLLKSWYTWWWSYSNLNRFTITWQVD